MPHILRTAPILLLVACGTFVPDPSGPGGPPPAQPDWAVPFRVGSTGLEEGRAITVIDDGVVMASWFSGTVDFDPGTATTGRTSFGAQDIAVARYSTGGELQWLFTSGGSGADVPNAIAATADGGVVVVGHSAGGGTCSGHTLQGLGGRDAVILKISADGLCEWGHLLGGTGDDEARGVAVAVDGSIAVAGWFSGTADFDPTGTAALLVSRGGSDGFLARFTAEGDFVDVAQMGGQDDDGLNAVIVSASGDVSVAGEFRGTATVGSALAPVVLASVGGADIVLARYTALLGLRWAVRAGGAGEDRGTALSEQPGGALVLAGTFEGSADLDGGPGAALVVSQGAADVFVARYETSAGNHTGVPFRFGGLGSEGVTAVVAHPGGGLLLSGWFQGSVDFDPSAGARIVVARGTSGAGDGFLAGFSAGDQFAWVVPVGGVVAGEGLTSMVAGMALGGSETVWTTGRFFGRSDFDPGSEAVELTALGQSDLFVAPYLTSSGALVVVPIEPEE